LPAATQSAIEFAQPLPHRIRLAPNVRVDVTLASRTMTASDAEISLDSAAFNCLVTRASGHIWMHIIRDLVEHGLAFLADLVIAVPRLSSRDDFTRREYTAIVRSDEQNDSRCCPWESCFRARPGEAQFQALLRRVRFGTLAVREEGRLADREA